MLRVIGNLIYGIGWVVGEIKWRLGIIVHIPERYRRALSDVHPDDASTFRRL